MPVTLIVGTDKGGMLLRADDDREQWEVGELGFPGWRVTAAAPTWGSPSSPSKTPCL